MGKKTRIVLLSITAALAVFTFSAMWVVRPGSQNAVLDAARERQNEPLLSVSEPLETDVATLTAEEEMAGKVAGILASDDDFISSLAASIAGIIPVDAYIPEITEAVYERISADYDSIAEQAAAIADEAFESNALAVYEKYKAEISEELVMAVLEKYDSLSDEEKSEILSLDALLLGLYPAYRTALAEDIISMIPSDEITAEEAEALAAEIYEKNRSYIIGDIEEAILSDYASLSAGDKAVTLALEEIYSHYRDAIAADIISSVPADEITAEEIRAVAAELYDENRDYIVGDIESALIADYSSLTDGEKLALLDLPEHDIEAQALELYDEYREAIASDVASMVGSEPAAASAEESPAIIEEPAVIEEPAAERRPIVNPSFPETGVISPDSSAEEYAAARDAQRRAEIEKALQFLAD